MTTFQTAEILWRDKKVDGVYSSDDHEPDKADIRAWAMWVQSGISAGTLNGPWEATLAALEAKLAYGDGNPGFVYEGADIGAYRKSGASGAGSWVKIFSFIPGYQIVKATNSGSGSANAIVATTEPQVSYSDGAQIISLNITETNTSEDVTVNFDTLGDLVIKTAANNKPAVGGLVAPVRIWGQVDQSGTVFRMMSDQSGAAIQTAAEAAQTAAEAARDVALGVLATVLDPVFPTIATAEVFAPEIAPDYIRTAGYGAAGDGGGALYIKAVSEPSHAGKFMITLDDASTEVWYELSKGQPIFAEMFGADPTGATFSTTAIQNAIVFLRGGGQSINNGLTDKSVTAYTSGVLNFGGGRSVFKIAPDAILITQELNLVFQGKGSRGKTNYARAETTIMVSGTSGGYGVHAYGNGSRGFRLLDLDLTYETSGFTGNVLMLTGSPGSYPERCMIGTHGGPDSVPRLQTARACVSVSYDEFFNPNECVFDGADIGIKIEDENRLAKFTASITSNVMTVTAVSAGHVGVGLNLWYVGIALGRSILSYGTGTGGVGTYNVTAGSDATSRDFEADLSFGGSNSNINNCVFYDVTSKSIVFNGLRGRARQAIRSSIVNPINIDADVGFDLRNIDGLLIDNVDCVGSVGNAPSSSWLNIENCTGAVTNSILGGFTKGMYVGGNMTVNGNTFNGTSGANLTAGILCAKGNKFALSTGVGWTIPSSGSVFVDMGPDFFNGNVTYSYNVQASGDGNGRIYRAVDYDSSINGVVDGAAGITITSL